MAAPRRHRCEGLAIVDETVAKIEAEQAPPPATGPMFGEVAEGYWDVYAPSHLKTASRYAHALRKNKRAAIDVLDGLGGGRSTTK